MQNRPPYELRGALVVYNALQILFKGFDVLLNMSNDVVQRLQSYLSADGLL